MLQFMSLTCENGTLRRTKCLSRTDVILAQKVAFTMCISSVTERSLLHEEIPFKNIAPAAPQNNWGMSC